MASEGQLNTLLNFGQNTATSFGSSAKDALGQATNWFKSLLGGDRSAIMRDIAPAANAARSGADAAKKELATKGTARTGGDVAQSQQIEDEVRKQIDTLIGQSQQNAANSLKGIGDTELNTMLNALGITTNAVASDVASQRQASASLWGSLIGGAAKIGAAFI